MAAATSDSLGDRFAEALLIPAGLGLAVGVLLALRPGYGRMSVIGILSSALVAVIAVLSDSTISPKPGYGVAAVLSGTVLGIIAALPTGPILWVAISSIFSGITVAMVAPFALYRQYTTAALKALDAQFSALINTQHTILFVCIIIGGYATGIAILALYRLLREDKSVLELSPKVRTYIDVPFAVLIAVFWILVLAAHTDVALGRWWLMLALLTAFAHGLVKGATFPSGCGNALLAHANGCLVLSAAGLCGAASVLGHRTGFFFLLPQCAAAAIAIGSARLWYSQITQSVRKNFVVNMINGPPTLRYLAFFLIGGSVLALVLLVSTRYHNVVYIGLIGVAIGTGAFQSSDLHEPGHVILLLVLHATYSFIAFTGVDLIKGLNTESEKAGFTVAFFGFASLAGTAFNAFKLFIDRLNIRRNRFTVSIIEAPGTEPQVLFHDSTGQPTAGESYKEHADETQAGVETLSPFSAPAPAAGGGSDPESGAGSRPEPASAPGTTETDI